MRLQQFLSSIWQPKQWYAIEWWSDDGVERITASLFRKEKGEVDLLEVKEFDSWNGFTDTAKKNIPLLLVIHTKQVVSRFEPMDATDTVQDIQRFFPDLDPSIFYYQTAAIAAQSYAAIISRSIVDPVLHSLQENGFYVIDMVLGLAPIAALADLTTESEIPINGHVFQLGANGISSSPSNEKKDVPIRFGDLNINQKSVLGLGALLLHLQGDSHSRNSDEAIRPIRSEFDYAQKFKSLLVVFLAVIFGVLLVNFLLFSSYFNRTGELEQWAATSAVDKEILTALDDNVRRKENRVRAIWSQSDSRASLKIDELAAIIPSSVILERMGYQPLERPIREGDAVLLQENNVILAGTHRNPEAYSNWLAAMEQLDWVQTVRTLTYAQEGSNRFAFEIEIQGYDQ